MTFINREKKQRSANSRLNNLLWGLFIVAPIIYTTIYILIIYKKPLKIISETNGLDHEYTWNAHSDKLHNGKSEISKKQNTSHFEYEYCLKDGYRFKFALIGIEKNNNKEIDLSGYNEINIDIKAKYGKGILFYMYTAFQKGEKIDSPSWPHQYIIKTDTVFSNITISINDLYTPDWWYTDVDKTRASLGNPLYNKTLAISFGHCIHMNTNTPDIVTIKNLNFSVDLIPYIQKLLPYILSYYLILSFSLIIYKKRRKKIVFINSSEDIYSKKQGEEDLVFNTIGRYYHKHNYTLEMLCKEVNLSETKVNHIIKKKTGLSFKQFINSIRVSEAKRLLVETDLPVNELAEKVGFNTREHFNRLFKSKTGLNPLEVRKKKSALAE